jgi:hypothetical protein
MEEKFKLVRGARIIQALAEESTPQELTRNIAIGFPKTKKRQHATQSVSVAQVKFTPYVKDKTLRVSAVATNSGNQYTPTILFNEVTFEPEDTSTNTTFIASNREEYNIRPISLKDHTVKLRCNCLDFHHRFAVWNFQDDSLYGKKPPTYIPKTNRPPVNPLRVPGLCKHLLKLIRQLKTVKIVK